MNKETHDQNIYIHIPKTENDERNRDRYYGLSPLDGNVEIHRVMVIRSRQFHSPNIVLIPPTLLQSFALLRDTFRRSKANDQPDPCIRIFV